MYLKNDCLTIGLFSKIIDLVDYDGVDFHLFIDRFVFLRYGI